MLLWQKIALAVGIGLLLYLAFHVVRKITCNSNTLYMPRILSQNENSKILNIRPRRMWGWGLWANTMLGYCGESSLQIAAPYFGNYFSQEQILKAANGSFMIGVNDGVCFPNLHMNWEFWPNIFGPGGPSIYDILKYIKQQIDNNMPVILGLYCNEDGGDASFDHQCLAVGYDLDDTAAVKTIWLLDTYEIRLIPFDCSLQNYQCLSGDDACNTPPLPPDEPVGPPSYPTEPFPVCFKRREDFANPNKQAPYDVAIPNVMTNKKCKPTPCDDLGNALCTVKGNVDPNNELYPCWLDMNSVFEPNWGTEDQINAKPIPISCKVYMEGLKPGTSYSLLRFDKPTDVPVQGDFINSNGYTMRVDFIACGKSNMIEVKHDPKVWPFMSDGTYFFRCVETKGVGMKQNFPYGTDRTDHHLGPVPPSPSHATLGNPALKTWDMTGWRPRFKDVVQNRIDEYTRKLKGLPRKHGRRIKTTPKVKSNNIVGACTPLEVGPANIKCGDSSTGNINGLWQWKFPDITWQGRPVGCMTMYFTVQDRGTEAKNCVNFTVENDDSDPNPPFPLTSVTGVIIYDVDGKNPRMYIEDANSYDYAFYTYSFSPDPQQPDGSFIMLSQDGVTYSTLTPIADSS